MQDQSNYKTVERHRSFQVTVPGTGSYLGRIGMQSHKANSLSCSQISSGFISGEFKARVTKTKSQRKKKFEPLLTEEFDIDAEPLSQESQQNSGANPRSRKFRESIVGDYEDLSSNSVAHVEIENNVRSQTAKVDSQPILSSTNQVLD